MPAKEAQPGSEPSGKGKGVDEVSGDANGGIPMECGMEKLGDMTGQMDTPALRAQIAETVGHNLIRWIRPGDAITRDMRPNRLNVELDEQGRIASLRCY